jgi:hypothetical protein
MHPLLIIAVPLALIIIGMVLNSFDLSFDQPPSSPEQDPAKRLAAEIASATRRLRGRKEWVNTAYLIKLPGVRQDAADGKKSRHE